MTGASAVIDDVTESPANSRLYDGPAIQQAEIAYGFLCADKIGALKADVVDGDQLDLFPDGDDLAAFDSERNVVPLPLSEFLAYKSALAYLDEPELSATLRDTTPGISHFCFFDSKKAAHKIGDTQGYGFIYQNKAFVIMRGTSSSTDWRGNLNDKDSSQVTDHELKKHGLSREEFLPDGKMEPDRHFGFCLGWAAVRQQIEEWVASLPRKDKHTFVLSGHSLGGALAFIGAYEFRDFHGRDVGAVITFGAPLAGSTTFAQAYNQILGTRTLRFEAKGDSVPRIMQRRYYRLYKRMKQTIQRLAKKRTKTDLPGPVGFCLSFAEQPLLNRDDMNYVITTAIEEQQRLLREQATEPGNDDNSDETDSLDETTDYSDEDPTNSNLDTNDAGSSSQSDTGNDKLPVILFGVLVAGVVVIGGWIFAKRKLASHNITQRYALYLSTLSYQRLRELQAGNLESANEYLRHYKKFIRGDFDGTESHPLQPIREMPVELNPKDKIDYFLSARKENIV